MNKQYKLLVLFLLINTSGMFGQTMLEPYWLYNNHHLTDKYIINPAFAGNQYYPKIFIGMQQTELHLPEAPSVHLLGAHSRLGIKKNYVNRYVANDRSARNAVGGLMFADNNGPFQTIGIKLDYAYSIPLDDKHTSLTFGLGGMLFSKRVRFSTLIDDPLIVENMGNSVMIPDFNTGLVLFHRQFYAGFSVSQLLENSYLFSKFNYTPPQVYRNFYLLAGYRLVHEIFEVEPSIAVGHNLAPASYGNNGKFIDVNVECFLKPIVFAVSYRVNGYITTSLQYRSQYMELGVRTELFSTNSTDARLNSAALTASYTFLPANTRRWGNN